MGDSIDEIPAWTVENQGLSCDLEESDADSAPIADDKSNDKKSKKKQKFLEMKKKKLIPREPAPTGMNPEEEYLKFVGNLPPDNALHQKGLFTFIKQVHKPIIEEKKTGEKAPCPFAGTIAAAVPSFRKKYCSASNDAEKFGCATVIIVCSGARRATQVISSISGKFKCRIGKLFAKHFKLQEQIDTLTKNYYPIAVGTPNRLSKLIEYGALRLSLTTLILIDMGVDSKGFTLLTIPEIKDDFADFLTGCVIAEKEHIRLSFVDPLQSA